MSVYNATGPEKELSMKAMVEGVRKGVGSDASFTWINNDFLKSQGIKDGQFPLYAPPTGESAGLHRCNISRALAKGLKFRPISETAKDTLDWYKSLPPDLQTRVAPQFAKFPEGPPWIDTEKQLLAAWGKHEAGRH